MYVFTVFYFRFIAHFEYSWYDSYFNFKPSRREYIHNNIKRNYNQTDDTYQDIDLFFSAISFSPVTIPSIESIQRDRPITEITFATYGKCVS